MTILVFSIEVVRECRMNLVVSCCSPARRTHLLGHSLFLILIIKLRNLTKRSHLGINDLQIDQLYIFKQLHKNQFTPPIVLELYLLFLFRLGNKSKV